jgi:hypothetical protein
MTEVLHDYGILHANGSAYHVRACGSEMDETLWQGWVEFEPIDAGEPTVLRSPRETTQPNRTDAVYWATGLSAVYLEGALERALHPHAASPQAAPTGRGPETASVLNPFSVYRKGEALLRDQLQALAPWHLVNIILAYDLSRIPAEDLPGMSAPELIELIVNGVRMETAERASADHKQPISTET